MSVDPFDDSNDKQYASAKQAKEAIRKERQAKKDAETSTLYNDEWEEVSSDNGELVEWKVEGDYIQGTYLGPVEIELPEHQQKVLPDGELQTTAIMHVFDTADGRESCWDTWQLKEIMNSKWQVGQYGRIEYIGSRAAKQGSVKRFKVLVRKQAGSASNAVGK